MSILLDKLLALSATTPPTIAALSSESVVVLLFAQQLLASYYNWLDTAEDPIDEISSADQAEIDRLVGDIYWQIMHPLIGIVMPYVTADPPANTLACDGGTYNRVDYPDLYAALDSAFITDADTFVTPDLRGRTLIGAGTGSGLSARAVGAAGGEETHQLTIGELATHQHGLFMTSDVVRRGVGDIYTAMMENVVELKSTAYEGGDNPHNNMQPWTALKYCIGAS